jgi:hypothetical protein
MRKIFGTKANLVTGELRILNEELCNRSGEDYITSSSIICTHQVSNQEGRRLTQHVASTDSRSANKDLVVIPEGKKPFGRPRRRPEDSINIDLWEIKRGTVGAWTGFVCRMI